MTRTMMQTAMVSLMMGFVGSALAMGLFLPSIVAAQSPQLRADRLVINSEAGSDRVVLKGSPGPAEGAVQLVDVNGKTRVGVDMGGPDGTIPNAFGFHLRAEDGTIIANLGVVKNATGVSLVLSDQQGHGRINLLVDSDGTPSMQMLDADGNVIWSAP
jgi:hypothetical protein